MQKKRSSNQDPGRPPMNDNIRSAQVRLIDQDGEQLGILSTREALDKAYKAGLDLVLIGKQDPPVAKIMDYGKYKFEREKEEKERKKKGKTQTSLKEIKMSGRIDSHDLEIKRKRVYGWLEEGFKVKVIVQLRGRELQRPELAYKLLEQFQHACEPVGKPDANPPFRREGRMFTMMMAPK